VNQKLGYKYTVNACDNAEPGAGKDTFFISVTGPNFSYSNGGFITGGNIQIHSRLRHGTPARPRGGPRRLKCP